MADPYQAAGVTLTVRRPPSFTLELHRRKPPMRYVPTLQRVSRGGRLPIGGCVTSHLRGVQDFARLAIACLRASG